MVRFAIAGSGWRALFFIRAAKALPELLEVTAVQVRSEEKRRFIEGNYGVPAVMGMDDVLASKPDLVVSAVSKKDMFTVSKAYMEKGIPVLAETPGAFSVEELKEALAYEPKVGYEIAEQYFLRPRYSALCALARSGLIGEPTGLYCSLAHDYHGISLIRKILGKEEQPERIIREIVEDRVPGTFDRSHDKADGSVKSVPRTVALYRFPSGEYALFDFTFYQYHCPVRRPSFRLEGTRGEVRDNEVWYYKEDNELVSSHLDEVVELADRTDPDPLQRRVEVVRRVSCDGVTLFENEFPDAVLSEDEYAIALLLLGRAHYPALEAIQDALTSLG